MSGGAPGAADTIDYNHVGTLDAPECRNPSREYKQHYESIVAQVDALLGTHDSVSKVIGDLRLPLDELQDDNVVMPGSFELESIARVYLFRQVADLSQNKVSDRIDKWEYLQIRFGLDRTPTQQALSYIERRRFSLGLRILLKDIAEGIREAATGIHS